jgi:acetolactate synthase I/II/III large subunit
MKLSDYMIDFLALNGVTHIFEVAGGSITHLLNSLYGRKDVVSISMHHEQAAAFAAEGYARACGKIGVAMATSGPGATNLITGIGSCYFDSVPSLFITGQVNTYEFKFDRQVRQIGFQETDIVSIVKPIVKEAVLITDEKTIVETLTRLVNTAYEGRQGPVLIDLPMNVQRADISSPRIVVCVPDKIDVSFEVIKTVSRMIYESSRPVILAGGGIRNANTTGDLYEFAHNNNIPVVSSLMGIDAFPHDDELYMGMIGTYGNRYANLAVANADLLIAIGTRMDTRQTGTKPETFARFAKIIHVDIDKSELGSKRAADLQVHADAGVFLRKLNENQGRRPDTREWLDIVKQYQRQYSSYVKTSGESIDPNYFMHLLSGYLPENAIICVDVGQNQIWSAQSLEIRRQQRFMTEGGMASLGSALPMAIGASFAMPGYPVVVITGDGGFQMNIQELQTVRHHNLPIKIIMLNNNCYGLIRQFQHQYMDDRFQSTVIGYSAPDFQKVVSAYDINVVKIDNSDSIEAAIKKIFDIDGPAFLEVSISDDIIVTPKLGVNRPIEEQDPQLSEEEMKMNMIVNRTV